MYPELTRDEVFMIGTERLWLRWPRHADAERCAAIQGHPDVASMTASWPIGCDAAFARGRIDKQRAANTAGAALTLTIAKRGDWFGSIGLVGIGVMADDDAGVRAGNLGYALDPALRGQGYVPEAIDALINMTRLLTRLDVVRAGVMPHNKASMRVLDKLGFVRGKPYLHESPIKGSIEVIGFERSLRRSARERGSSQRASRRDGAPGVIDPSCRATAA